MSAPLAIDLCNNILRQVRHGASGKTVCITIGVCLAVFLIFLIGICMLEIRAESARTSIESQVERGTLRSSPTDATDNGDLLAENIQAPVWRPQPTVGYFDVSRQEKSFFELRMELRYLADMRDRGLSLKQAEELWRQHTALQSRPILFTPPGPLQRHPNTPRRYHR